VRRPCPRALQQGGRCPRRSNTAEYRARPRSARRAGCQHLSKSHNREGRTLRSAGGRAVVTTSDLPGATPQRGPQPSESTHSQSTGHASSPRSIQPRATPSSDTTAGSGPGRVVPGSGSCTESGETTSPRSPSVSGQRSPSTPRLGHPDHLLQERLKYPYGKNTAPVQYMSTIVELLSSVAVCTTHRRLPVTISNGTPRTILFLGVHNAGRSQMATGFARHLGGS
jgi:hypothetical protein